MPLVKLLTCGDLRADGFHFVLWRSCSGWMPLASQVDGWSNARPVDRGDMRAIYYPVKQRADLLLHH
jgi:hypothetical protein